VTFFFDNNFSDAIPRILAELDVEASHLRDHFDGHAKDVDWIPIVGSRGWVLLTADEAIRRVPIEAQALRDAQIVTFFFGKWYLRRKKWDQVLWILKHWPEIDRRAREARPGESFLVNSKCQFTRKTV
jgi:hypothetical protein